MRKSGIPYVLFLLLISFFTVPCQSQTCSAGSLQGGTASAFTTNVCPAQPIAISIAGGSSGQGISFQWQSSTDSSTWTDIPGGTYDGLFTSVPTDTWFRRRTDCISGGSVYSSVLKLTSKDFSTCYCTTGASCITGMTITNVSFGSINNSSGCSDGGYTDYTTTVSKAVILKGNWMPISVTVANASTTRVVSCFIDLNHNGAFEANETTILTNPSGSTYSGYLKIPYNAKNGSTRLRITFDSSPRDACQQNYLSETEDYQVDIQPNATGSRGFVIYVKPNVTGSNGTGSNWANAVSSVQAAGKLASAGDTIKVAAGTYYGGTSLTDSIILLGGYPNTGNPGDINRNPALNPTILSGRQSSSSTQYDYSVLYLNGAKDCLIDGFIIQEGGVLSNYPTLSRGGGISIVDSKNISVKKCVFRNNNPYIPGAAIAVVNAGADFESCIVTKNSGSSDILVQSGAKVNFSNLLAAANNDDYLIQSDSSQLKITNSTLAGNISSRVLISASSSSQLQLSNSILYYNSIYIASDASLTYDSSEIKAANSTVALRNCLTQVINTGINLITGATPKFKDGSSVAGADGFYFTPDDGFTLLNPCSPALNAGSNTDVASVSDIIGVSRIFGSSVDLGAYETQDVVTSIPHVIYVNAAATGRNNGSSWADAFTDLHRALQVCSDTIKVAGGIYYPWQAPSKSYYWLENKRVILGAYPSTGNPGDVDRDYVKYPTELSGIINSTSNAITIARGIRLDSTSILDGLTITNAGTDTWSHDGAITYLYCNKPLISNCTFTNNKRRVFMGDQNENLQFKYCTIANNTGYKSSYSTDLFNIVNSQSLTIKNCRFSDNQLPANTSTIGEFGKMLSLSSANITIDSILFLRNAGTCIALGGSNGTITNSRFINNTGGSSPNDLYLIESHPTFSHCVFSDSLYNGANVRTMHTIRSNPIFRDCSFENIQGSIAYNDSSSSKFFNCLFKRSINTFFNIRNSNIELTNCINIESMAYSNEAAFMHNINSSPKLINCVIINSNAAQSSLMINETNSHPRIHNSIFWRNFRRFGQTNGNIFTRSEITNLSGSLPIATNSMFEVYDAGSANNNMTGIDPRFKNIDNLVGPDSVWFSADDGLRLCDCSPAINTGDNANADVANDITGQPRIFDNTVDRGAYELQQSPGSTRKAVYVRAGAVGSNTGADWSNAMNDLHQALNNPCVDTIHLAAGTYKPAKQERDSVFYINRNITLLGSYDLASGKRDVDMTPTILSGDIGVPNDSSDNSYGVLKAFYFDSLRVDGIVFRDINRSSYGPPKNFHAVTAEYLLKASITNCRFYNNYTLSNGASIYLSQANKINIQKSVFSNNTAQSGAGIYMIYNGSERAITDCVFEGNTATYSGASMWISENNTHIANCVFTHNKARMGGGIYFFENASALITNSTFDNNYIYNGGKVGAAIYGGNAGNYATGPQVVNCLFTANGFQGQTVEGQQSAFYDMYFDEYGGEVSGPKLMWRVHYSATNTPTYYNSIGLISPSTVHYKNYADPIGPDKKWFTDDDGLQLSHCTTGGVDQGQNSSIQVDHDILDRNRIYGATVDMGAYEYNGSPTWSKVPGIASDTSIANKEYTDSMGWTHYYKDCNYLLSIKKGGQDIGKVGDGSFEARIITTSKYGSGMANDLTNAAYNNNDAWYTINRKWSVRPTHQINDSILVRFPFTNTDTSDLKGSMATISLPQLQLFHIADTDDAFALATDAAHFVKYNNGIEASLSSWKYIHQDTVHLAEFYVKSLGAGSAGATVTGPLPDLTISSAHAAVNNVPVNSSISVTVTEANIGKGTAGAHQVLFYLSPDSTLTPGQNNDILLGKQFYDSLAGNNNVGSLIKSLAIPCSVTSGNYQLFVVADGNSSVAESDESNNQFILPITITGVVVPISTPLISITSNPSMCANTPVVLSAASSGCTNCTYTWNNGTMSSALSVTANGNYSVIASDGCTTASASQAVSFVPVPVVTIAATSTFICSGTSTTLTASGATSYTWAAADGLAASTNASVSATPTASTTYSVTGMTNGCTATKTYTITVTPTPAKPTISSTGGTSVCSGRSVVLTSTGGANTIWYYNGTIITGANGQSYSAQSPGDYTAQCNVNGCVSPFSNAITITPGSTPATPVITASPSATICPGSSTTLTATVTGCTGCGYSWNGSFLTANPSLVVSTAGTYQVIVDNGCGTSSASQIVTMSPNVTPSIQITYSGCPSNNLQFTATTTNGGSSPTIDWFVNNNTIAGSGLTYTLNNAANNVQVYARLTSNALCASPQTVTSAVTTVNCITTDIPNIDGLIYFEVSPNPTTGLLIVTLKLTQRKTIQFELFDNVGKVIYAYSSTSNGLNMFKIDLTNKAKGIYYLKTTIDGKSRTDKIVLF